MRISKHSFDTAIDNLKNRRDTLEGCLDYINTDNEIQEILGRIRGINEAISYLLLSVKEEE